MNLGERLAVHLPGEHDFVGLDFRPWHTDDVVHCLVLFEVRFGAVQFEMLSTVDETAASFDELLQADADVARGPNGT